MRLSWAVVVSLCCLTLLIGWWSKARCLDASGWSGGEQYLQWCYTDVYPLWFSEHLSEGATPYLDHPVEYPVLTGAQMWLSAWAARQVPRHLPGVAFFHINAALGAVWTFGVLALLGRAGLPPSRLAWWAAAPSLAAYAFMNWDLLRSFLLTLALVLHLSSKDVWSGAVAGLGAAAKMFPALVVPILAAERLAQGRKGAAVSQLGAASFAWLAVNLPVALAAPAGWWRFFELSRERPPDWDTLWYFAQHVLGRGFDTSTVNFGSATMFAVGAVAILMLGGRRRPPGSWWSLILPLLCWFLLTSKVYSPQFSLWLLPLMALALPSAAPFAAFLVADLMVFATRFPFLGGVQDLTPAPGYGVFAFAVVARAAVLVWVIGLFLLPQAGMRRPNLPPLTNESPCSEGLRQITLSQVEADGWGR